MYTWMMQHKYLTLIGFSLFLCLLTVSCCAQSVSPAYAGKWESDEYIVSTASGEIDGGQYLFFITQNVARLSTPVLHILDVDNPYAPSETATMEMPNGMAKSGGMVISDDYLYVGMMKGESAGLWVMDVSIPEKPKEIVPFGEDGLFMTRAAQDGNYIALQTTLSRDFVLYDISSPASPKMVSEFSGDWSDRRIPSYRAVNMVFCDKGMLVQDVDGITAFDLSDSSNPRQTAFYSNEEWDGPYRKGIEGAGSTTTVLTETVEDFQDLFIPPGNFLDIDISGDYAFVAASDMGLVVLDVSDLGSIEEVSRLDLPDRARKIRISGKYAYIMGLAIHSDDGLSSLSEISYPVYIVDISKPRAPRLLDTIEGIGGIPSYQRLEVAEEAVYVISGKTVSLFDLHAR